MNTISVLWISFIWEKRTLSDHIPRLHSTTSAVDLSDRDNKETLVVIEEETYDADAFERAFPSYIQNQIEAPEFFPFVTDFRLVKPNILILCALLENCSQLFWLQFPAGKKQAK